MVTPTTGTAEHDEDNGAPTQPEDNLGLQVVRCMSRSVDYRRDRGWNVLSLSVDLD